MTEGILPGCLPSLLQDECVHRRYARLTLQCECVHVCACAFSMCQGGQEEISSASSGPGEGGTVGSLRRPLGIKDRNAGPGRAKPSSLKGFH